MDNFEYLNNEFGNVMKGLEKAVVLLDSNLLDEHKSKMSADDLAQYDKMKRLTGVDLKKAAESLMNLDKRYDKKSR